MFQQVLTDVHSQEHETVLLLHLSSTHVDELCVFLLPFLLKINNHLGSADVVQQLLSHAELSLLLVMQLMMVVSSAYVTVEPLHLRGGSHGCTE